MKKKTIITIIVALVIIAGVAYWFSHKYNRIDKEKSIIKIGVILPLTGDRAAFGQNSKKGLDLAAKEINMTSTSKYKLLLIPEDSRGKAQTAISSFIKLINEDVKIVVGPISSQEVLAIAPIAESKKVILFSPGASSPEITSAGEYIIRNVPSDVYEASLMAEFTFDSLYLKRIAIIYNNSDYGVGVEKVFEKKMKERGGDVLAIGFSPEVTDFKSHLQRFKDYHPDAIYFVGYTELGKMIKQAKEMGFNCQFLTTAIFEDQSILKVASSTSEGIIFTSITFDISNPSPRAKRFVEMYKKAYNELPDGYAAVAYDAIHIISNAIRYSQDHRCSVKDALYKTKNFPALLGTLTFDKNGDVILPISLKTVKNGNFTNY